MTNIDFKFHLTRAVPPPDDNGDLIRKSRRKFREPAPWERHFDDAEGGDKSSDFDETAFLAGKGNFVRCSVERDLNNRGADS